MNLDLDTRTYPKLQNFFDSKIRFNYLLKGRQIGATRGGARNLIEKCLREPGAYMWLDVGFKQLRKYLNTYFFPVLKKLPKELNLWHWHAIEDQITFWNGSVIYFRTYSNPDAVEGLTIEKAIYINEAGFVLQEPEMFEESLLPMTMVYKAQFFMFGTPKSAIGSYAHQLWEKNQDNPAWNLVKISTYDAPHIDREEVENMEKMMDTNTAKSELYGEFPDVNDAIWLYMFCKDHLKQVLNTKKGWYLSLDFNVGKNALVVAELTEDNNLYIHKEIFWRDLVELTKFIDALKIIAPIKLMVGDVSGNARELIHPETTAWNEVSKIAGLKPTLMKHNLRLQESYSVCNSFVAQNRLFVNPACINVVKDLTTCKAKSDFTVDKSSADASHMLDAVRYLIHYIARSENRRFGIAQ